MTALERVRANAGPYPTYLLEGCETGLLLFGAAFLGANDGIHFLDAGLRCIVVDNDMERLCDMWEAYPDECGWNFIHGDAWRIAERYPEGSSLPKKYDAVSVDCWTGDQEKPVLDSLELWCSLASKLVTVTVGNTTTFLAPVGWTFSFFRRSSLARWLILERDPAF